MSVRETFEFYQCKAREWEGRYNRINSESSVFHVVHRNCQYVIQAYIQTSEGRVSCQAESSKAVTEMIATINDVKRRYAGHPGGSFLINEYGQVLVPTNRGPRLLIGETSGIMLLRNLETEQILNLADDSHLETGDPWNLPYVGMVYNLSQRNRLYCKSQEKGTIEDPPFRDRELINKIRNTRRSGPIKFLVNPYGLILTKIPIGSFDVDDEDTWAPIYIGRINYRKWFEKEEFYQCRTSS